MVIRLREIDASIILDAKYDQRFIKYVATFRATGYPAEIADFYPRFFQLLRRCGSLWRIRMPDSPDTCGRKPYPERKSCGFKLSGYVWTRPKAVKFFRRGVWFENAGIASIRLSTLRINSAQPHIFNSFIQVALRRVLIAGGCGFVKDKEIYFFCTFVWFEAVTCHSINVLQL